MGGWDSVGGCCFVRASVCLKATERTCIPVFKGNVVSTAMVMGLQNNKEQPSRGDVDVEDRFDCQIVGARGRACSLEWSCVSDKLHPVSSLPHPESATTS